MFGLFLPKLRGWVRFAVCILQIELNQTKPHFVTTQTSLNPHSTQTQTYSIISLRLQAIFSSSHLD